MAASAAAVRRFVALSRQMQVTDLYVLATAAPREAANGAEFMAAVEAATGVRPTGPVGHGGGTPGGLGRGVGRSQAGRRCRRSRRRQSEVVDVRAKGIGTGESFPLGGLILEEAAERSIKKAEKIVAEVLSGSKVLAGRREARRSTRLAARGARSRACTCARPATAACHAPLHHRPRRSGGLLPNGGHDAISTRSTSIEVVSRNRRPLLPYGAVVLEQVIKRMRPSSIVMSALGRARGAALRPSRRQREEPAIRCWTPAANWHTCAHGRPAPRWSSRRGARRFSRRSASMRLPRRCVCGKRRACLPTSAGGPIRSIAASKAST